MNTDINSPIWGENAIRTYTGKVFDLVKLDPDSICIEDIAHALANTPRFGGHLKFQYSVAQHSILVAEMVPEHLQLQALLHDASEAYLGDMPSPFKELLPDFKFQEHRVTKAIAKKYGIEYPPFDPEVKAADNAMLHKEWRSFIEGSQEIIYWPPEMAESAFLRVFKILVKSKM